MRPIPIFPVLALLCAIASCGGPKLGPGPSGVGGLPAGLTEAGPVDESKVVAGQVVFVPAYSYVYTSDKAQPLNLATTLYVRNTDANRPIVLTRVGYFDSGGKLVREYLKSPSRLGPMASAGFFVAESDVGGGASPSFLVEWAGEHEVSDPVAESVMIGTAGTQGISFTTPGRVVRSRKP